jgi:hypothetical protein
MQRERRSNNLQTATKPTDMLPAQEDDPGPLARAKVAKGRTVHLPLPTGAKRIVGTRAAEVNGVIMYRDVTAVEYRSAQPGEIVELPEVEVQRLTALGFLIDDKPAKRGNGKGVVDPLTGIVDDPRTAARIR